MYKFQDPELFPNDLLTQFSSSEKIDPIGYVKLYEAAAKVADPLLVSKILPLVLAALSLIYMTLLGKALGGMRAGIIMGILFTLELYVTDWGKFFSAGVPRGFAMPLFGAFLYYRARNKQLAGTAMPVLQSLFYPPIYLNSAALWCISLLRRSWLAHIKKEAILLFGIVVGGLILLSMYNSNPAFLGPLVTRHESLSMPEFGPLGRSSFYRDNPLIYLFMGRAGLSLNKISPQIVMLILMGFVLGKRLFHVDRLVYDLIASSLLLYALSHLLLFRLHLPSRYVLYSMPVAFNLLIALNADRLVETIKAKYGLNLPDLIPAKALTLAVIAVTIPLLAYQGVTRKPDPDMVELTRFFRDKPKDIVIAGPPRDMNDIPLFSKRKVLVSHELSLPYYTTYYRKIKQRTFDFFAAYYSDNPHDVLEFCRKYGVDYLVINARHFDKNFIRGRIYYSPFDEYAKGVIKKSKRFVLTTIDNSKLVFHNKTYSVIKCDEETLTTTNNRREPDDRRERHPARVQ